MIPALFVSHGAPTLLSDDCPAREFLQSAADTIPRPRGILCVSAHWDTAEPQVTGVPFPDTIHDFYGFPSHLYDVRYSAPGSLSLAEQVIGLLGEASFSAKMDGRRGLDHGAWVPLALMYPAADIPVVQLSVQSRAGPEHHLALGSALASLRGDDVLILASGGATHNLADFGHSGLNAAPVEYARAFSQWLEDKVVDGDLDALASYRTRAPHGMRNHPTPEHFLPLFVAMGSGGPKATGRVVHRSFTYGILSMAAFAWG